MITKLDYNILDASKWHIDTNVSLICEFGIICKFKSPSEMLNTYTFIRTLPQRNVMYD